MNKSTQRGRPSPERVAAIDASILAAGTRLFLSKGYEGTSMEAVADEAGVQRRTLYRRYPHKSALLGAVLETRRLAWMKAAEQDAEPSSEILEERLKHHVAITLQWASTPEIRAFLRIANIALTQTGGSFRRDETFGFNIMIDRIAADILKFGPSQGFHTRDANSVAFALMALIAGWLELRNPSGPLTKQQSRMQATFFVKLVTLGREAW